QTCALPIWATCHRVSPARTIQWVPHSGSGGGSGIVASATTCASPTPTAADARPTTRMVATSCTNNANDCRPELRLGKGRRRIALSLRPRSRRARSTTTSAHLPCRHVDGAARGLPHPTCEHLLVAVLVAQVEQPDGLHPAQIVGPEHVKQPLQAHVVAPDTGSQRPVDDRSEERRVGKER